MTTAVKKPEVTEDELQAQIEAELAKQVEAELVQQMALKRADIVYRKRAEANMRHLQKINARHPVQDAPSPEVVAARHRLADEGLRRDAERRAANEERWARQWTNQGGRRK
jgi:hypothetical protein